MLGASSSSTSFVTCLDVVHNIHAVDIISLTSNSSSCSSVLRMNTSCPGPWQRVELMFRFTSSATQTETLGQSNFFRKFGGHFFVVRRRGVSELGAPSSLLSMDPYLTDLPVRLGMFGRGLSRMYGVSLGLFCVRKFQVRVL